MRRCQSPCGGENQMAGADAAYAPQARRQGQRSHENAQVAQAEKDEPAKRVDLGCGGGHDPKKKTARQRRAKAAARTETLERRAQRGTTTCRGWAEATAGATCEKGHPRSDDKLASKVGSTHPVPQLTGLRTRRPGTTAQTGTMMSSAGPPWPSVPPQQTASALWQGTAPRAEAGTGTA